MFSDLLYAGQSLRDDKSLDSYRIHPGITVHAMKKLKHPFATPGKQTAVLTRNFLYQSNGVLNHFNKIPFTLSQTCSFIAIKLINIAIIAHTIRSRISTMAPLFMARYSFILCRHLLLLALMLATVELEVTHRTVELYLSPSGRHVHSDSKLSHTLFDHIFPPLFIARYSFILCRHLHSLMLATECL